MKDVKVKVFSGYSDDVTEITNDFIRDKEVVDIKFISRSPYVAVLIIYQSNNPEPA